jgi:hypothetical protein
MTGYMNPSRNRDEASYHVVDEASYHVVDARARFPHVVAMGKSGITSALKIPLVLSSSSDPNACKPTALSRLRNNCLG